jgi:hypothetical protein
MPSLKFDNISKGVGRSHDDWINASPYWNNDDREMSRASRINRMTEKGRSMRRRRFHVDECGVIIHEVAPDAWKKYASPELLKAVQRRKAGLPSQGPKVYNPYGGAVTVLKRGTAAKAQEKAKESAAKVGTHGDTARGVAKEVGKQFKAKATSVGSRVSSAIQKGQELAQQHGVTGKGAAIAGGAALAGGIAGAALARRRKAQTKSKSEATLYYFQGLNIDQVGHIHESRSYKL